MSTLEDAQNHLKANGPTITKNQRTRVPNEAALEGVYITLQKSGNLTPGHNDFESAKNAHLRLQRAVVRGDLG